MAVEYQRVVASKQSPLYTRARSGAWMEGGTFTQGSVGSHVPSVAGVKQDPRAGSLSSEENKYEIAMSTKPVVDKDFLCPICIQTMKDAFLTACGHSFCYMCIMTHLSNKSNCPSCGLYLTNNQLFPNFLLNKVNLLLPMYSLSLRIVMKMLPSFETQLNLSTCRLMIFLAWNDLS